MNRRSFLSKTALGGAAAFAAPALAQGARRLTMVTSWARDNVGLSDAAQRVADRLAEMSQGALSVDLHAAHEFVGPYEVFDTVVSGQADMYHSADHYFLDRHAAYAFFTAVPFGMTAQNLTAWYNKGQGQALHDSLGKIYGLKSFLAGHTGAQAGGWFRQEITAPEDFQDLVMRLPGLGAATLAQMGALAKTLPLAETRAALASGDLDAAAWIGPWADEEAGFQDITQTYYPGGFQAPGSALSLGINRAVHDSLTSAERDMLATACAEAYEWSRSRFVSRNPPALTRLQEAGVTLHEFPEQVWAAFGQATLEMHEVNRDDPVYRRVHDDYRAAMRSMTGGKAESDNPFMQQRARLLKAAEPG